MYVDVWGVGVGGYYCEGFILLWFLCLGVECGLCEVGWVFFDDLYGMVYWF